MLFFVKKTLKTFFSTNLFENSGGKRMKKIIDSTILSDAVEEYYTAIRKLEIWNWKSSSGNVLNFQIV